MKNYFYLFIVFYFFLPSFHTVKAQGLQLSDEAEISILTGSPGNALYAAFGHTAIHIKDNANGIDVLFNYGIFDFETPNFYMKFLQGKLLYQLAITDYDGLIALYKEENRTLVEQYLLLDKTQKQEVFDFLVDNSKPENCAYKYDFFFDNCATRVRDVFNKVLGDQLKWDLSKFPVDKSFRDLINPYIVKMPWVDMGMDLILGMPTDRKANLQEYMFLPDYIHHGLINSKINIDGRLKPFVIKEVRIIEDKIPIDDNPLPMPLLLFSGILLIFGGLAYWDFKRKKIMYGIDMFLFGISGLAGLLFLFFWFGTDHLALPYNWNLLWAIPTHLFIALVFPFFRKTSWLRYYFLGTALIGLLTLILWNVLPQELPLPIFPLVVLLALRAGNIYYTGFEVKA